MADDFPSGAEAVRLLALAERQSGPLLHLTVGEERAETIARLLGPRLGAVVFPAWDCLPYDTASPSLEAMGRRMALLRRMEAGDAPALVVTTPHAILQRVPPASALRSFEVRPGERLDLDAFRHRCAAVGYLIDERVDEPGEVAFRGEVIDIFPAAQPHPYRLEIDGGVVQAIRCYDPATQRSTGETSALAIDAVSELPQPEDAAGDEEESRSPGAEHRLPEAYPELATLFDYLPDARLAMSDAARRAAEALLGQIREAHDDRVRHKAGGGRGMAPLAPDRLYLSAEEWRRHARNAEAVETGGSAAVPAFVTLPRPRSRFAAFLREQSEAGRRIVLAAKAERDRDRLARAAATALDRDAVEAGDWTDALDAGPGALLTLAAPLHRGFVLESDALAVLAAEDLLGSRAADTGEDRAAPGPWQIEAAEFHLGDIVVHAEHGVGELLGLESLGETGGEAIRLGYAKEQRLLVPVAEAGEIWRYGSGESGVKLDRLDTDAWAKRRAKVSQGLAETARGLVAAAADRATREAPKLVPLQRAYERFVARFPFSPTPDQRRAIRAVLDDLASGRPMNRLVVGDVGFGKTEVALRAAAAAALSGKQVAVVAPTTVLARQHANTFRRRFAELGVEVAHLSRLVPPKEAQAVRTGLAEGRVQVVIGTHALLGKNVRFADLGLLVVDEEQRFGAEHKKKLRALGEGVHLLTMTATPIPRTLQSALVGLHDLSTIATPPSRRRPIRTLVAEDDPTTLRQALLRERRRGGQSFVVVPRVEDIEPTAERLRKLAPRLDLRVAHGQMPAREIDETMVGFADGDGDVLLATTIIESGLDVPRANTMVVLRPELLGLAQLHQLRGRVGRSHLQAWCYLVHEPGAKLSPAALRRLGTLQAYDRLGAGMAISAQDLDMRGGGDLFGERQAGHIKLIGLGLYQELLAGALRRARGEPEAEPPVEFQTDAAASLPADYVPEEEVRITLYHRLARTAEPADVDRLAEEIADRFGPPPDPVRALLAAASVRARARALDVARITAGPEAIALDFAPGISGEREFAGPLKRLPELEWSGERLLYRKPSDTAEARTALVADLFEALS